MRISFLKVGQGLALALSLIATPSFADVVTTFPSSKRLVSIGGSLTEIIYALGAEKRLVARDVTSTFPVEVQALPDVGYIRALSPEGVLSVAPDAVIALQGAGPKETIDVLKNASVPVVFVPESYDRAGVVNKVRTVGIALGIDASELTQSLDAELEKIETEAAQRAEKKSVLFILSLAGDRIMAAGENSAADGMIGLAGGRNALSRFSGYKPVNAEAILTANPDVIIMMSTGPSEALTDEEVLSHPAIAQTSAGKNKALIRRDGSYLLDFGTRTAAAAKDLSGAIYGN